MSPTSPPPIGPRIALFLPLLVAAFLIFAGLGSFGLWEPHESDRADLVSTMVDDEDRAAAAAKVGPGFHLGERLAALTWSLLGQSELSARLPSAILALLAVLVLYATVLVLADKRTAIYAALIFASAPVLLLHGRQLTSGAPLLFGETCAFAGLALLAFGKGQRTLAAGAMLTGLGLVTSFLAAGLLMGVAVPAGSILATLAATGDLKKIFSADERPDRRRQIVAFLAAPILLLAIGGFLSIAVPDTADVPLVTGGLATGTVKARSFDYGLELLSYGWFPWTALVPILLVTRRADDGDGWRTRLETLALCGLAVGYLAHNVFFALHGETPLFLALPMSLAVALSLKRLEESRQPAVLLGLFGAVVLVILVRDFAQRPEMILSPLAWDKIPLPKDFKPIYAAAAAAAPFAVLLVLMTFFGTGDPDRSRWRRWRTVVLVPLAAVAIGGYVTFFLVPGLSVDLSSRHVVEAYEKFADDGAPLGIFGPNRPPVAAEKLRTQAELLSWLGKDDRVFAMFPPSNLAAVDRAYRQEHGRHVFLLDAKSERLVLATNKPRQGEKDENPIAELVSSKPFDPGPKKRKKVNFDNKVTFLGFSLRSESGAPHLEQGKDFELISYWRCDDKMSKNYKVFIHIDGAGPRIHGDHMPVNDIFPTREWRPGDYIKDVYNGEVPLYQAKGSYRVRLGLYKGKSRMKIVDEPTAKENAVDLGRVDLK
jgi:hypothetical protein